MSDIGELGGNPLANPALAPLTAQLLLALNSAVNFLMIESTMGAVQVVMLLALLFFSNRTTRRKPIFLLNLVALLLSIGHAINNLYLEIYSLTNPTGIIRPVNLILVALFAGILPTYIDFVLLLRLHAAFPPHATGLGQYAILMGIPIALNLARLANSLVYITAYARNIHALANSSGGNVAGAAVLVNLRLPSVKVEWVLQIVADLYSSTLFLSRFQLSHLLRSSASFSKKLSTLFWLSVSNFVFPALLSIAQLAVFLASPDLYATAEYIEEVNTHFTVICVVFATIWAFEGSWEDNRNNSSRNLNGHGHEHSGSSEDVESEMRFRIRAPGPPHPMSDILYDKPRVVNADSTISSGSPRSSHLDEPKISTTLERVGDVEEGELGRLDLHGTVLSRMGMAI
ncbi:hypothetical protein PENSPDRAFT_628633 [Peniophora sp. CONT]|nr:hypothetical protein PENSPDRAFT_628633 [Peniophora sp. CONT]